MTGNDLLIKAIKEHVKIRLDNHQKMDNFGQKIALDPYAILEQGILAIIEDYERLKLVEGK